ncbi:MAG: Uncharacterized protein YmdB, partial [uncultured Gemmatimonadetes bacterium]
EDPVRGGRDRVAGPAGGGAAPEAGQKGRGGGRGGAQRRELRRRLRDHAGHRPRVPGAGGGRHHHRQPRVGQEGDPSPPQDRAAPAAAGQLPAAQPGPRARGGQGRRGAAGGDQPAGAHLHGPAGRPLPHGRGPAGGAARRGGRGGGGLPRGGHQREAGVRALPGRARGRRGGDAHALPDGGRARAPRRHGADHGPGAHRRAGRGDRDEDRALGGAAAHAGPRRAASAGRRGADAAGRSGGRGRDDRARPLHPAGERSLRAGPPGGVQEEV